MSKDQAIKILIQAVEVATKAGAYELKDAGVIASAVAVLLTPDPAPAPAPAPAPENTTEEKTTE